MPRIPLSIVVAPANRHDVTQIKPALDSRWCVVRASTRAKQRLCVDDAFDAGSADRAVITPPERRVGAYEVHSEHYRADRRIVSPLQVMTPLPRHSKIVGRFGLGGRYRHQDARIDSE